MPASKLSESRHSNFDHLVIRGRKVELESVLDETIFAPGKIAELRARQETIAFFDWFAGAMV